VCLNGACVACSPGSKSCANATTPQTCAPSGSWAADPACAGSKQCFDWVCKDLCCRLAYPNGTTQTIPCINGAWTCTGAASTSLCTQTGQCTTGLTCTTSGTVGLVGLCQ
jgi:hypothetical protein